MKSGAFRDKSGDCENQRNELLKGHYETWNSINRTFQRRLKNNHDKKLGMVAHAQGKSCIMLIC